MKLQFTLILFICGIIFSNAQKKWSLQECIDYALENNISIKQSKLTTDFSKEDITIAKSRLLPNVSANASQNLMVNSGYERINPSNNFGVSASVDIYNGGRNKLAVNQSKNTVAINQLVLQTLENDINLQVATNYLNALLSKENIKIAQEQINITKFQLSNMEELIAAGVNPRVDILNIQATLAQNKERLVQAENNLDLALLDLAQLIQIPPDNFDIQDVTINIDKAVLLYNNSDIVYKKALETRPEIKKASLDIENADLAVKVAKTSILPSISINYGLNTSYAYRFSGDGLFNNITNQYNDNHGHNIGISARYPIFNANQNRASIRKAKINKQIIEESLANEKLRLRRAIERAYLDVKTSLKQYETSLKSFIAQEESFKFAQERYKLGAMNLFDFDLVRNGLFNAKISLINAKYNFIFRQKVLDFYANEPITIE